MSNINYNNNYNEIFEDYNLKLNKQTLAIDELDIYLNNKSSNKIDYGDKKDKFFQDDSYINGIDYYS